MQAASRCGLRVASIFPAEGRPLSDHTMHFLAAPKTLHMPNRGHARRAVLHTLLRVTRTRHHSSTVLELGRHRETGREARAT